MGFISAIPLPKKVVLHDFRLGLLHTFLRVLALGWVSYTMLFGELPAYHTVKEPKGQQIAWIGGYNGVYEAQVTTDEAAPFCADSSQYDYCYDEGCASSLYEFKNINCERLPYYEAYKKTQSESGYIFYVPTFFKRENRDTQLVPVGHSDHVLGDCDASCDALGACPVQTGSVGRYTADETMADGSCKCKCVLISDTFVKGVEGLTLEMYHKAATDEQAASSETEEDKMLTILVDKEGEELARFEPGVNLKLTIGEMLEAAHFNMDTFTMGDAKNYATGDNIKEQAVARHTGMSIDISMEYYNDWDRGYKKKMPKDYEGKDPAVLCIVQLSGTPEWQSTQDIDYSRRAPGGAGTYESKYAYNVKISISAKGSFTSLNLLGLSSGLAVALVYWKMPTQFIGMFSKKCLGTKSKVYKAAQREDLHFETLFASILAQGIVANRVFDWMVGKEVKGTTEDEKIADAQQQSQISARQMDREILGLFSGGADTITSDDDAMIVRGALARRMGSANRRKFVDVLLGHNYVDLKLIGAYYDADNTQLPFMERLFTSEKKADLMTVTRADFAAMHVGLTEAEKDAIFAKADKDGNGKIDAREMNDYVFKQSMKSNNLGRIDDIQEHDMEEGKKR